MRDVTKLRIAGIAIGLAGLALLWWAAGWAVSVGTFLAMWGNNVGLRSNGNSAHE